MKFKSLVLGMTAACMTLAHLPVVNAQTDEAVTGTDFPSFGRESGRGPGKGGFSRAGRQQIGRGGPGRRGGRGAAQLSLERLDQNDDGVIDSGEFVSSRLIGLERKFSRQDANSDGELSIDEVRRERPPGAPVIDRVAVTACVEASIPEYDPREQLADIFDTIDTDDNAALSLAELSTSTEQKALEHFARIDADADGLLTETELTAAHQTVLAVRGFVRACIDQIADPFEVETEL